jgi:uncharacterized spore protein YtfJ
MAATEPERPEFADEVADVADRLQESANARTVFGEAIERGNRTVVPVARIAYGFGGGFGDQSTDEDAGEGGTGAGMGGGAMAKPVGALEITDHETRFVPLQGGRRLALLVGAFVLGMLFGRLGTRAADE